MMLLPGFEQEQPLIGEGQNSLIASLLPPEYRALLRTIMGSESAYPGKDPYRVMYGGKEIGSFDDHPRKMHPIVSGPNKGNVTSAAGGYQFLGRSWDEAKNALGLPDFTPESQDQGAVWHAEQLYKRKTGGDLQTAIREAQGDPAKLQSIGQQLSGWWTSLPGGIEPNPATRSFASRFQKELQAPDTFGGPALYNPDDERVTRYARASLPTSPPNYTQGGGSPPSSGGGTPTNEDATMPANATSTLGGGLFDQLTGGGSGEAAGGEGGYNPLLMMLGLQLMANSQPSTEPTNLFQGMPGVVMAAQRQQQLAADRKSNRSMEDERLKIARDRLNFDIERGGETRTELVKEYEYAKNNSGFKGTFLEYVAAKRAGAGEYGMTPVYGTKNGKPVIMQLGKSGTPLEVPLPEGVELTTGVEKIDLGTEWGIIDKRSGQVIGRQPKDIQGKEAAEKRGQAQGAAQVALPTAVKSAEYSLSLIDEMMKHPGRETATGLSGTLDPRNYIPGTSASDFRARQKQMEGRTFLSAYEQLRGGGAITEAEGQRATIAHARLINAQSDEEFYDALRELREVLVTGIEVARQKASGNFSAPSSDGWTEIDGVKIRKKN